MRSALLIASLLWVGCDSLPGLPETDSHAPVVSSLTYDPSVVALDGSADVTVTVHLEVSATDADGDIDEVAYVVQTPLPSSVAVASGTLSRSGARYAADASVTFPAAAPGPYTLVVYAFDKAGNVGNTVRGTIEFGQGGSGSPPVIDAVELPDRVQRPATGDPAVPVSIVVTASDPDGLANINRVETQVNGGVTLLLCDDGGQASCNTGFGSSGDTVAGDGRFTLTIEIASSNSTGVNTFVFKVVDRSGLESQTVTRTITVE